VASIAGRVMITFQCGDSDPRNTGYESVTFIGADGEKDARFGLQSIYCNDFTRAINMIREVMRYWPRNHAKQNAMLKPSYVSIG
jgi:hypothetical protein